jgi:solute carrier family 25 oxoglutarate transporter 11
MTQRRNYKNVFHALYWISLDEGLLALWKGAGPTAVCAMALNMGMLASYDQSIEFFRDSLHFSEAPTVVGKALYNPIYSYSSSFYEGIDTIKW